MDARSNNGKVGINYTMVSRWYNPQNKKDLMSSRFGVMNSAFQLTEMSGADIFNAIKRGASFTNMAIEGGKLVVSNGSVDKYTTFNGGNSMLEGEYRAVILGRVEANDKLAGYVLYDASGAIRKIRTPEAAEMAKNGLIANGKIRETQSGPIVSSIKGEYPIITIDVNKKKEAVAASHNQFESCTITPLYFGECTNKEGSDTAKYVGAIVKCTDMMMYRDMANFLYESCADTIKKATAIGNNNAKKELSCIRMGDSSCFGAFGLNAFMTLVKKGAKVSVKERTSIISQLYSGNNMEEACVQLVYKDKGFLMQASKNDGEESKRMAAKSAEGYLKLLKELCDRASKK